MSSPATVPPVLHETAAQRFVVQVEAFTAVAEYELADGRVIFTHTFVPPELRGRGLAERLVRAGLEWARAEGRRVVPQCSYVATFIQRHAEYQPLLG